MTTLRRFTRWFFGIGGEDHRQVYWGWREYPRGMAHAMLFGFLVGIAASTVTCMVLK